MAQDGGLVQISSHYSVDESVRRLQIAFEEKALKVFATILKPLTITALQ